MFRALNDVLFRRLVRRQDRRERTAQERVDGVEFGESVDQLQQLLLESRCLIHGLKYWPTLRCRLLPFLNTLSHSKTP